MRIYCLLDGARTILQRFWAAPEDPRLADPNVVEEEGPWHVEGANYDSARGAWEAAAEAVAARLATDEQERTNAVLDGAIVSLLDQTKAEWLSWASSNFPTLTAAERTRLGTLFWVVAIGVRREVRRGA